MPPRVRLTTIQLALVRAIKAGKSADYPTLAGALGVDARKAAQMLGNAEGSGIIALKRDGKAIVVSSAKLTKRGEELFAATDDDDETAIQAPPTKKTGKAPKRGGRKPRAQASAVDGIEQCRSVTYDDAELAELVDLVAQHRTIGDRIAALVDSIARSPKIGAEGAHLVRILAKLHAKDAG